MNAQEIPRRRRQPGEGRRPCSGRHHCLSSLAVAKLALRRVVVGSGHCVPCEHDRRRRHRTSHASRGWQNARRPAHIPGTTRRQTPKTLRRRPELANYRNRCPTRAVYCRSRHRRRRDTRVRPAARAAHHTARLIQPAQILREGTISRRHANHNRNWDEHLRTTSPHNTAHHLPGDTPHRSLSRRLNPSRRSLLRLRPDGNRQPSRKHQHRHRTNRETPHNPPNLHFTHGACQIFCVTGRDVFHRMWSAILSP